MRARPRLAWVALAAMGAAAVLAALWPGPPAGAPGAAREGDGTAATAPLPGTAAAPPRAPGEQPRRAAEVSLRLRFVHPDRRAAADCEVWLLALAGDDPLLDAAVRGPDGYAAVLEEHGAAARADASGVLRVPAPAAGVLLVAARDGWGSGEASWRPGQPFELEVVLAERRELAVRVVGADGAPLAGVPLVLAARAGRALSGSERARSRAPDGIARFAGFGRFRASLPPSARACFVAPNLVWAEPRWLELPLDVPAAPSAPPPELRLPPTGEVVVRIPTSAGVAEGVTLAALAVPGAESGLDGEVAINPASSEVVDGIALFRFVPVGQRLEASVYLRGRAGMARLAGEGPRLAGQRVEWVLEQAAPLELRGRVTRPDGAPLARAALVATLSDGEAGEYRQPLETDGGGGFRLLLADDAASRDWRALRLAPPLAGLPAPASESLDAWCPLAPPLAPGVHDLGTLVLGPSPIVAAGEVVGADGAPIAGAVLAVERRVEEDAGLGEAWAPLVDLRAGSGVDGRFRVQGRAAPGRHRLSARKAGWVLESPLEFTLGQEGLRLALRAAGRLEARVLLPDGMVLGDLAASLRRGGGAGETWAPDRVEGAGGVLAWDRLAPGSYDLTVGPRLGDAPVRIVPGLAVVAGAATRDARLDPLDLRALLRVVRIEITGAAGEALAERPTLLRLGGASGTVSGFRQVDERGFELAMPAGVAWDLLVRAEGHRSAILRGVTADTAVRLEPELRIPLLRSRLEPAGLVGVELLPAGEWAEEDLLALGRPRVTGDPARDLVLHAVLAHPGRFQLVWLQRLPGHPLQRLPGPTLTLDPTTPPVPLN